MRAASLALQNSSSENYRIRQARTVSSGMSSSFIVLSDYTTKLLGCFAGIIFESLGGVSREAELVIKRLNQAVASATDSPYGEVATRFWQRISIDIQRSQHRAFVRRVAGVAGSEVLGSGGVFGSLGRLEIPGGV